MLPRVSARFKGASPYVSKIATLCWLCLVATEELLVHDICVFGMARIPQPLQKVLPREFLAMWQLHTN